MEGNKAQKPCPCGYYGDGTAKCHCTADQIEKYKNKISGPLLDRIDMVLTVPPLPKKDLLSQENANAESSEVIRKRVLKAYEFINFIRAEFVIGFALAIYLFFIGF
jgi:magnesium chelatase family protein